MDPQAAWRALIVMCKRGTLPAIEEAKDYLEHLTRWCGRGGFKPTATQEEIDLAIEKLRGMYGRSTRERIEAVVVIPEVKPQS